MDSPPRPVERAPAEVPAIRPARPADVERLWDLVLRFADYERLGHLATGSPARLSAHLFGSEWPRIECLVAEVDGALVGYAIFLGGYSTFWTKPLMWLEDLYVDESHRARGLGKALMAAVACVALERGCPRMDWAVLDWNASSIEFYERLGATRHGGWFTYRLEGGRLEELAAETKTKIETRARSE